MNKLALGLAGILLAGGLSSNAVAQKRLKAHERAAQERTYVDGNVNGVGYGLTTEEDFSPYKIEEQCLFDEDSCYTFWDYTPKNKNELNFWVSKKEEESMVFEEGGKLKVKARRYIPTKIAQEADVTGLAIERTSYEKLKKRAKNSEYFGFSVDITDRDLRFKLPEIKIGDISYIVLAEVIDNSKERRDLPFGLIPKVKGTEVYIPFEPFTDVIGKKKYEIQATIKCDKNGGIFQPILESKETKSSSAESTGFPSFVPNGNKTSQTKESALENKVQTQENTQAQKSADVGVQTQINSGIQTQTNGSTDDKNIPCATKHVVQKGDTFYNISDLLYGTGKRANEIQDLNPDVKASGLKVGEEIIVPCK